MVNFLILVNLFDLVSLVILVIHLVITKGGGGGLNVNLENLENHLVILMVWVNLGSMVDLLKLVDMVYLVNLSILLI